jgi:hypothetical protein
LRLLTCLFVFLHLQSALCLEGWSVSIAGHDTVVGILRNMNLSSTHGVGNHLFLLASLGTCDVWNLRLCLRSSLSNSLNFGNNLLVFVICRRLDFFAYLWFTFVNLQFQYSVLWPSPASVWTPAHAAVLANAIFAFAANVRLKALTAFGGICSACAPRGFALALLPNLELVKAIIEIRRLALIGTASGSSFRNAFVIYKLLSLWMAFGAVTCIASDAAAFGVSVLG